MLTTLGNNDAREAILASVRRSLSASAPFDAVHRSHHSHVELLRPIQRPTSSSPQLIDNFKANLEFVGGTCTVVANETAAAKMVAEIIEQTGAKKIAV
jgi:L-lactate utilization protein LutB